MKFLKYSILTVVAASALTFTACSDEDYEPATQSPGAYFPSSLASSLNISPEGPSFSVEVDRVSADSDDSYVLTSVDESGLFSIPSSVNFASGALTTEVVISYDPAQLVGKQAYPITLTIEGGSVYGSSTYEFNAIMRPDYTEVAFDQATDGVNGYGTYNFNAMGWGSEEYYMTKMYTDDVKDEVDVIHNFMAYFFDESDGFDFEIARNMNNVDPATNTVPVTIERQYIGYNHSSYGKIYIVDKGTWYKELQADPTYGIEDEDVADAAAGSYYDVATGTYYLSVCYIIPEYGEGYRVGAGTDTFQFDGFAETWVNVSYKGYMTYANGDLAAIAGVTAGDGATLLRAAMFEGSDIQAGIDAIVDGSASNRQNITSFSSDAETEISFSFDAGGSYSIVVVAFDDNNEAIDYGYVTFNIELGNSEWKTLGTGEYADPWIVPGYGVDNTQYAWYVTVKQSTSNPDIYCLADPYHEDSMPLSNTSTEAYNVVFDLGENYCFVEPQKISFQNNSFTGTENYITNYEGYLAANNEDVSKADIVAFVISKGNEASSYEDGLVTINNAMFSYPGITGSTSYYSWNSGQAGLILMPESSAAAKRKAKAFRVAAPKLNGYKATMKAVAPEKHQFGIATKVTRANKSAQKAARIRK